MLNYSIKDETFVKSNRAMKFVKELDRLMKKHGISIIFDKATKEVILTYYCELQIAPFVKCSIVSKDLGTKKYESIGRQFLCKCGKFLELDSDAYLPGVNLHIGCECGREYRFGVWDILNDCESNINPQEKFVQTFRKHD